MKKKNIVILGSSGSIGESALDVVRRYKDRFNVVGLSVNSNLERLKSQIKEFNPLSVAVGDADRACELAKSLRRGPEVLASREGICELARLKEADLVLIAIVGAEAVFPLLSAIKAKKTIALANKESVVIAGRLVRREALRHNVKIIPVDSEQSAIFQCLEGYDNGMVEGVYLTASGGPLVDYSAGQLRGVPLKKVLAHPRWKMGKKITVDSATLMNKGLEVIEAKELFGLALDRIKVLVHRQAIVHSMVEFCDGSILAQLAVTDMRLPIQVAMSYPERWPNRSLRLDPLKMGDLSFCQPDLKRFPCLALAYDAARRGGTLPCALNAANEVAVEAFLSGRISFMRIPDIVERVITKNRFSKDDLSLESIFETDWQARQSAMRLVGKDRGLR
ncbi:MAG TPA: 1-deoxy-D-xylulose-5-phosphate reductoisomerase [Candidatus Omnitrophica bacterium]|nr:1-deoxy-D-xylulose-5-phosphate reductoisomerase [Candidatus Omnitrophota bacterium]